MSILKFFSKEALWKEIIRRESFEDVSGEIESSMIWRSVFHRTPELSDFLKRRQINLLKVSALREKSSDFVLGQLSENMLAQRFDVAPVARIVEEEKKVQKLKPMAEVIEKFKAKTAAQKT